MAKLADILLTVMGWSNSHLHAFTVGQKRYGMNYDDFPEDEVDEKSVTVLEVLRAADRFDFEYDFGDSWEHEVVIEQLTLIPVGIKFAVCLDGANACPPDDVGGTGGYSEFLVAIGDASHEEHEDYLQWIGGSFNPTDFHLAEVNARLQAIR